MKKATDKAVEALKDMSQKVKGKEQIAKVAAISAGDEEVGNLVADAMEKVTNDGVITIEEATHIPEGFAYTTPESIHIESAYLWAIPYVITDIVLGSLYIVMYKT